MYGSSVWCLWTGVRSLRCRVVTRRGGSGSERPHITRDRVATPSVLLRTQCVTGVRGRTTVSFRYPKSGQDRESSSCRVRRLLTTRTGTRQSKAVDTGRYLPDWEVPDPGCCLITPSLWVLGDSGVVGGVSGYSWTFSGPLDSRGEGVMTFS